MQKIKVGIVFGGQSTEHEVSRRSAVNVIKSLDKSKFNYSLIEITKHGDFFLYGNIEENILFKEILKVENTLPKKSISKVGFDNVDVVFPVIHGTGGEDGVLQGLLEISDIAYVGCGVLSSAIGFDKVFSKIMFEYSEIPQAKYIFCTQESIDYEYVKKEVREKFRYPVFVKPSNGGSSVGIYKIKKEEELEIYLKKAFKYDRKVLIEENIKGREFECAVIGDYKNIEALGIGEIVPCNEFYDYKAKYIFEDSKTLVPAPIENEIAEKIKEFSIKAFKAIDAYGLARVDFFVSDKKEIFINEINTMPGFTSISMYPKIFENTGKNNRELITKLIEFAIQRKNTYRYIKEYFEE